MNLDVPSITPYTYSATAYGIGSQGGNNSVSLNNAYPVDTHIYPDGETNDHDAHI
jgi:hypothetical protein